MGKRLAAVGMAAVLGVGGLTVAAVNPLGVAGASTPAASTSAQQGAKAHRSGVLKKALDKLVADKTLTQAQADKVTAAVKSEVKATRQGHKGNRKERRQEVLGVAAKAIGSTPEAVTAGLKNGTSIAEQAKAKGIDRQVVVDALTKDLTARIDTALKEGKITPERGTKAKARVGEAVNRIVDATGHARHRAGN